MSLRIFAEQMPNSHRWQVIQQNSEHNDRFIVEKDLTKEEAREVAEKLQRAIDNDPDLK